MENANQINVGKDVGGDSHEDGDEESKGIIGGRVNGMPQLNLATQNTGGMLNTDSSKNLIVSYQVNTVRVDSGYQGN